MAPSDSDPIQIDVPHITEGSHQVDVGTSFQDCTWTEVFLSMQNASTEYREQTETSRLRAARRDKAIAVTLLSLTDMIPEQDGLCIMRGGLSTVFKVA